MCVAVKGNAYGHGLREIVGALIKEPVDYIATHTLEDARVARRARWRRGILSVGYHSLAESAEALALGVEPTVYNLANLKAWAAAARAQRTVAQIHVKVETGTNRQGVSGKELLELLQMIKRTRAVRLRGLSTHFANIEDTTDHTFAMAQLKRFKAALRVCERLGLRPELRHTAASAAHLVAPETRFDMIRAGIAVYGYWPSRETLVSFKHLNPSRNGERSLRPIVSLKSRIAQIKTIKKGESVGYGLTFRAERRMRVALAPLGYWDGLPRSWSSGGYVLIGGRRAPLVGRVSMNNIVFDISGLRNVQLEDEIVALGRSGDEEISIEQWAASSGTIHYEALTRLGAHLPRVMV